MKIKCIVMNHRNNFALTIFISPQYICRFLQGPETDMSTVKKIRDAIRDQTDVTVQLINYTKSGKH